MGMSRFGQWLQKSYWWFIKRVYPVHQIGSIEFVDARSKQEPSTAEILESVREAIARVAQAGETFGRLVEDQIRIVAALGNRRVGVWSGVRGYISGFEEAERNPHYLASRLVWTAEYFRLTAGRSIANAERASAREAATQAQLAFVTRFPDAERWRDYIKRHGD